MTTLFTVSKVLSIGEETVKCRDPNKFECYCVLKGGKLFMTNSERQRTGSFRQ